MEKNRPDEEKKSDQPVKEEKDKQTHPEKDIENNNNTDSKEKSNLSETILILIVIATAILIIISFKQAYDQNSLEYKCSEIENHPSLAYPCTCTPLIDDENAEKDAVEQQTDAMCRCSCDIGADEPYIIDIRAAQE